MEYQIVNTIGLTLTIIGCLLLYLFGLPPDVNPKGTSAIILEQVDQDEIAEGRRYRTRGRLGIGLIAIGSLCQIFATWISK